MFNLFNKQEVLPEVLNAYKWRIPDKLDVSIKPSKDGGYIAYVKNLEGCVTQGDTGQELFEMVNDAMLVYLEIPQQYRIYMPTFLPPEEVRNELNIKIPTKFLDKDLVLQRN